MNVIRIAPRGYCHGVVGAMNTVRSAIDDSTLPRPIYIVGMIVHNQHVVDACTEQGVITLDGARNRLDLLDLADEGTVIFTAHGVSPAVRTKAAQRGLRVLDATCPDVTRTHDLIRERAAAGYDILYIGRKGHPEPEGAIGIAPHAVHLVETQSDVDRLHIDNARVAVTNQTTLSQWDTAALMDYIKLRYPQSEIYNEICLATQLRQQAVAEQVRGAQLCIVVGDPRSHNSNRLVQVAQDIGGTPARLVSDVAQISPDWLRGVSQIAVSAGSSTPSPVTRAVIEYLEQFDEHHPATWAHPVGAGTPSILPRAHRAVPPSAAEPL